MDPRPLIVDVESAIEEVSGLLVAAGETVLQTGFVITEHGAYAGMGTGYDMLRELIACNSRSVIPRPAIPYPAILRAAARVPARPRPLAAR